MKICCVEGCPGPTNGDPIFFDFPTSRLLRKRWSDAISAPAKLPAEAAVCILHFRSEDYELVRGKTRLKSRVLPTLLVGDKTIKNGDTELSQESTETASSTEAIDDKIESTTNNQDNDNGKVHNDNGNNDNAHNDNGNNEHVHNDNGDSKNVNNDKEKVCNDNKSRIVDKEIGEVSLNNEDVQKDDINKQVKDDNTDKKTHNDNEQGSNDKTNNDNGNVDKNNEPVQKDNGKVQTGRKTRCKITAMRSVNGRACRRDDSESSSQDSVSSSPPSPDIECKEDIEGILTNYIIENKKTERQVAAMTDVLQEELDRREEERREQQRLEEKREEQLAEEEWPFVECAPVFIELSVGQEKGANATGQTENDCLMVLESVQCDVDPALLLAAREEGEEEIEEVDLADDEEDDDVQVITKKKEDPISLLTSSDEDEVIIQEQKIDTVEVSSADTSEDDIPLDKLFRKSKSKSKSPYKSNRAKMISKLLWGGSDFYCIHCRYTTANATEYTKHMATHSKILQLCPDCGFTTCSKVQMSRHKQKHKNERRYKCQRCNYSAKHKMSLVYHMKTHDITEVELATCDTYEPQSKISKTSGKSKKSEKSKAIEKITVSQISIEEKKYRCTKCDYRTRRNSDLKRHIMRLHKSLSSDDDDEYVP